MYVNCHTVYSRSLNSLSMPFFPVLPLYARRYLHTSWTSSSTTYGRRGLTISGVPTSPRIGMSSRNLFRLSLGSTWRPRDGTCTQQHSKKYFQCLSYWLQYSLSHTVPIPWFIFFLLTSLISLPSLLTPPLFLLHLLTLNTFLFQSFTSPSSFSLATTLYNYMYTYSVRVPIQTAQSRDVFFYPPFKYHP